MFVNRYKVLALKQLKRAAKVSRREKPVNVLVKAIAQEIQALDEKKNGIEDGVAQRYVLSSLEVICAN